MVERLPKRVKATVAMERGMERSSGGNCGERRVRVTERVRCLGDKMNKG